MTVSTRNPKLDFKSMLGDPDEQKPRTLREIADEVGFPFTARAVGNPFGTWVGGIGFEIQAARYFGGGVGVTGPQFPIDDGYRTFPAARSDIPRWVLLGHK